MQIRGKKGKAAGKGRNKGKEKKKRGEKMRSRLPLCCYICIHNPNVSDPGPDGIHLRTQRFVFQNRSSSQSILDPKHLRSLFQIATVSFGGGGIREEEKNKSAASGNWHTQIPGKWRTSALKPTSALSATCVWVPSNGGGGEGEKFLLSQSELRRFGLSRYRHLPNAGNRIQKPTAVNKDHLLREGHWEKGLIAAWSGREEKKKGSGWFGEEKKERSYGGWWHRAGKSRSFPTPSPWMGYSAGSGRAGKGAGPTAILGILICIARSDWRSEGSSEPLGSSPGPEQPPERGGAGLSRRGATPPRPTRGPQRPAGPPPSRPRKAAAHAAADRFQARYLKTPPPHTPRNVRMGLCVRGWGHERPPHPQHSPCTGLSARTWTLCVKPM